MAIKTFGTGTESKGTIVKKTPPMNSVVKKKPTVTMSPIVEKKQVMKTPAPKMNKYNPAQDSISYNKYTKANSGIKSKMPFDQWAKNKKPTR
jgi:hypothetical protein